RPAGGDRRPPKPKAASATERRKSAESGQSKPDETAKPAAANKSAAPAEQAKLEPPAPLPPKTSYYTFIVFPAGAYDIGSVNDEPGRIKSEVRHSVTLTRPFALLDCEITDEELIAFSPPEYAGDMAQFDAKPVVAASGAHWYDAVSFCRWLSQQSGLSEGDQ